MGDHAQAVAPANRLLVKNVSPRFTLTTDASSMTLALAHARIIVFAIPVRAPTTPRLTSPKPLRESCRLMCAAIAWGAMVDQDHAQAAALANRLLVKNVSPTFTRTIDALSMTLALVRARLLMVVDCRCFSLPGTPTALRLIHPNP